ncbi:hypothetical protein LHFGNBLO_003588 [Mesorhizobium sp. AR10]|nr:hypothetical protein LHFGNBLO_003588 [Mesorhizobium sp. AR10]
MALLLVSLLCLVQSDATAFATAASGGASISATRQGDAIALPRVAGKSQALEIRTARPVPTKFVSGNPGALAPHAAFLLLDRVPAIQAAVASVFAPALQTSANQPRAPPLR